MRGRGGCAHFQQEEALIHGAPASPLVLKVSSLSSNDDQGILMGTGREQEAGRWGGGWEDLQEETYFVENLFGVVLKLSWRMPW